eukprot:1160519-Pelagomonas_calceolata.AAC.4
MTDVIKKDASRPTCTAIPAKVCVSWYEYQLVEEEDTECHGHTCRHKLRQVGLRASSVHLHHNEHQGSALRASSVRLHHNEHQGRALRAQDQHDAAMEKKWSKTWMHPPSLTCLQHHQAKARSFGFLCAMAGHAPLSVI